MIETINPSTGERIHTYATLTHAEIHTRIQTSHQAFLTWRQTNFETRTNHFYALAELLLAKRTILAEQITAEMGKPLRAAIAEIEKCALVCQHYATHAPHYLQPKIIPTEYSSSYVCYQPTGIIFAIMPWNFPFWQVFRFAAPNLMAGNVGILKHAPIVTGCALSIEALFEEAGFPLHVFSTFVMKETDAETVIAHDYITGVTLTGSQRAGRAVAMQAGKALKKVVLELGGSDPYIILEDADLTEAANLCTRARLNNSGQVCVAAKRLIVIDEVYDAFLTKILGCIKHYRVGNPMQEEVDLGPLARADLRTTVARQVAVSIKQGATLLAGGHTMSGAGFFYPPTVLGDVTPGMTAFDEEIFDSPVPSFNPTETSDIKPFSSTTRSDGAIKSNGVA
ncbi:MAG: aldehyde dehydrogenase family protein, partial [Pseudomonadota bacterium]